MTEEIEQQDMAAQPLNLEHQNFRLGDRVVVDPVENCVYVDGERHSLEPKAMNVLVYLAEQAHVRRVVPKQELLDKFWENDTDVDGSLAGRINRIRSALGDDPKKPKYLETYRKVGYGLLVHATRITEPVPETLIVVDEPRKLSAKRFGFLLTGALLALLVLIVAWFGTQGNDNAQAPPAARDGVYSLAVLPLRSDSLEPPFEQLGENISEELISALGQFEQFELVSRRTSFELDKNGATLREIGKQLNVEFVLDGRVTKIDDTYFVAVELAETEGERAKWLNKKGYKLDNIARASSDIARNLAHELKIVLGTRQAERLEQLSARSQEAYRQYLEARKIINGPRSEAALLEAVDRFSEVNRLDPTFVGAQAGVCEAFVTLYGLEQAPEYFTQAEENCKKVASADTGAADAEIALGMLYRERGDYDLAINGLRNVVGAFPRNTAAMVELGDTYAAAGRNEEALEIYERAVNLTPSEYEAQAALAVFHYRKQRYSAALKYAKRAVMINSRQPGPRNLLAATHYALEEFDAAAAQFEKSLEYGSTRAALTNLGLVAYSAGDFAEAERRQRSALQMSPNDHRLLGRLAESIRHQPERAEESQIVYKDAALSAVNRIAANPNDALAHARLGNFRMHLGETARASEHFARAHELSPENNVVYFFEATALASNREVEKTVEALNAAVRLGLSRELIRRDPDIRALGDSPLIAPFLNAQ